MWLSAMYSEYHGKVKFPPAINSRIPSCVSYWQVSPYCMYPRFRYGLLLVILLAALPLAGHLNHMPIQSWDEARLALNALEMDQHGDYIVTHFNGQPDMWNTKPPLLIWLQVAALKLIGYNEIAVRLPSVLAAFCTCLLIFWFAARKLRQPWLGIFAVIVLVTSNGYVYRHGARSGDYDALLVFFTTAYSLFFFWYLETGQRKWLLFFFTALTCAVLTKGIAGLLPGPALFVYALFRKQTLYMFRTVTFYLGLSLFLVFGIGYYVLREHYNPGYIAAVQANELGGRFSAAVESHTGDQWFYWDYLVKQHYSYWCLLVLPGVVIGLAAVHDTLQRFTGYVGLLCSVYLLVISNAATKLSWYDMPMFPFMAFLCAISLWSLFNMLLSQEGWKSSLRVNVLPFLVIAFICFAPYRTIIETVFDPKPDPGSVWAESMGYFMKDNLSGKRNDGSFSITANGEEQHLMWYQRALNARGRQIDFRFPDQVKPGQELAVYQDNVRDYVQAHFHVRVLDQVDLVTVFRVDSIKVQKDERVARAQ